MGENGSPRRGESDVTRVAVEQTDTQMSFQSLYGLGERGLSHAHSRGGVPEVTVLGHGNEQLEVA